MGTVNVVEQTELYLFSVLPGISPRLQMQVPMGFPHAKNLSEQTGSCTWFPHEKGTLFAKVTLVYIQSEATIFHLIID